VAPADRGSCRTRSRSSRATDKNQARFGDAIHDLLDALDMGEDRSTESDEEEGEEGEQDRRKEESGRGRTGRRRG
jgi:hypothetical protein